MSRPERQSAPEPLSAREHQIAKAYAQGLSYRQIAERLHIAPATVRTHLGTIYRKLGVSTKIDLLRALERDGDTGDAVAVRPALRPQAAGAVRTTGDERRQVTVVSALPEGLGDLALSEDPEEFAVLIEAFKSVADAAIDRHSGRRLVSRSTEALACFGLPDSDETDAERAVRCALDIHTGLRRGRDPAGESLGVRIGIFTGPVLASSAADDTADLTGSAPLLAAALAREARDGGPISIDGGPVLLQGFAVGDAVVVKTRFEALHGYRLTPFAGREHEIGLLQTLFRRAEVGEGQIAVVSGEPGIGKSRLVRALCERLALAPEAMLVFQCSPHERSSPLHGVAQAFRQIAAVERFETQSARVEALAALFADAIEDPDRDPGLLAELASVRHDPAQGQEPLPADKRRAALLTLLDRFLCRKAEQGPLLAVFEDMHWADPTTGEWLEGIARLSENLPLMVIATARPEFAFGASADANVTTLALSRLGRAELERIVAEQAPKRPLAPAVVARIVERSEGIPLFAEELTRAILDLGETGDVVPTTLQASLMGRLDRLGAARDVAQAAAVIGRDFDAGLLAEIVPEAAPLGAALGALLASRLVLRRAAAGAGAYQFKHALVRDAAYASLLKARREALHATVADRLIARHEQGSDVAPELIAHHYTEAGLAEKAVPQWRLAGGYAAARSAHLEAIAHLSKGLELLATLPETRDRAEQELALKIALGPAILATRGFGDPALAETYERARELAEQLQDDTNHFTALWGLWIYHLASERFKTADALSTQLLSAAGRHSDSAIHLQAHHAAWTTGFFRGEFASCLDHTEKGESYYDRQRHRTHKFRYGGHDPAVCSLAFRSFAEWLMGFPDRALASSQRAVDLAIEIGHPNSHAQALTTKAIVHYFRGEAEAAYEMGQATVALCAEHGLGMWAPLLMEVSQAALASCGRGEQSLDATRESIAALQQTGVGIFGPFRLATFVDALRRVGQSGAAAESLGFLDAAQSIIDRKGEIWFQAEIHRLRGEVLLDGPAIAKQEGEAGLHRAIKTARTQEARSLELRAATSLARHWVNNDNRTEAHDLLAPAYGWFTEGFDTADLKEAKALLDKLA